jgi:hypothetical protein
MQPAALAVPIVASASAALKRANLVRLAFMCK